jgi:hypothetical protein
MMANRMTIKNTGRLSAIDAGSLPVFVELSPVY